MTSPPDDAPLTDRLQRRLLRAVGNSRLLRRWGPRILPRVDLKVFRWSRGRWMPSRLLRPIAVLHTTRRDGTPCHTPLLVARDPSGSFLVMATNFGLPRHPAWSHHLLRDPYAALTWRGQTLRVRARLLTPEELLAARDRILAAMPVFDDYAVRSGRNVRVFVLTPLPGSADASSAATSGRR
jgi:deazaflavin-dependent oxidoreductase (nitroreductase family)